MKKLLIIMLVLTFVLAAATAALAGRGRWDNTGETSSPNAPNYVRYQDLSNSYKQAGAGDPHGGYTTTTNVCSFCHAVHNAGINGNGGQVWKLTRSSTNDLMGACNFCHYTGGIANVQPFSTSGFDGPVRGEHRLGATVIPDSTLGTAPLNDGQLDCFDCHNAAPHAAAPAGAGYKMTKDVGANDAKDYLICQRCHDKNYTTGYNAKTHVMMTSPSGGASQNGRGATEYIVGDNVTSSDCDNCHTNVDGIGQYPHISRAARFLQSDAGNLNTAGTGGTLDSVCMICHNDGGRTVGTDY